MLHTNHIGKNLKVWQYQVLANCVIKWEVSNAMARKGGIIGITALENTLALSTTFEDIHSF